MDTIFKKNLIKKISLTKEIVDEKRENTKEEMKEKIITHWTEKTPDFLLLIMNCALNIIALALCVMLFKETISFSKLIYYAIVGDVHYEQMLEKIISFFLYFEFIGLIMKYFKNNYHFPLNYFIYIGITAIIRLIIIEHHNPISIIIWSGAILLLIISLAISRSYIEIDKERSIKDKPKNKV